MRDRTAHARARRALHRRTNSCYRTTLTSLYGDAYDALLAFKCVLLDRDDSSSAHSTAPIILGAQKVEAVRGELVVPAPVAVVHVWEP